MSSRKGVYIPCKFHKGMFSTERYIELSGAAESQESLVVEFNRIFVHDGNRYTKIEKGDIEGEGYVRGVYLGNQGDGRYLIGIPNNWDHCLSQVSVPQDSIYTDQN